MNIPKWFILLFFAFGLGLVGCQEMAPVDSNLEVLDLRNDLAEGTLHRELDVKGEEFSLIASYSTLDYDTANWRITDSKALEIALRISEVVSGTQVTVLVEHMHADISVQSHLAGVDGITQDSMDDKIHGGTQPGFWINEEYPYRTIFAIEGYSDRLINGWGFIVGDTGSGSVHQRRLTEENLIDSGKVYGNKISVVYDLLIKYEGEELYHTVSILDEFIIQIAE